MQIVGFITFIYPDLLHGITMTVVVVPFELCRIVRGELSVFDVSINCCPRNDNGSLIIFEPPEYRSDSCIWLAAWYKWSLILFSVDKKNQIDVTFCILYFSSNSCSTCFGQPCAHHQELTTA